MGADVSGGVAHILFVYTLDTNAIIYYLKDDPHAAAILSGLLNEPITVYVSALTEAELFGFPDLSIEEENRIERLLSTLAVISLDSRIARITGFIRRTYRLSLADSTIAATALFTGTSLVTRNVRDFRRIPDLSVRPI